MASVRRTIAILLLAGIVFVGLTGGKSYRQAKITDASSITGTTSASGTDSFFAFDTFTIMDTRGYHTIRYYLTVTGPNSAVNGAGNEDSARIVLQSVRPGAVFPFDSVEGPLPQTLTGVLPYATGDSLLGESVRAIVEVVDTLNDTVATLEYTLTYDVLVK